MTQPLQHQADRPAQVVVIASSAYFTRGKPYDVIRWNEGTPWVVNDLGTKTWLVEPRMWAPVPEPMTMRRSQDLLHAAYRAQCASREHG